MKGPDKISQSPPPLYHSITFHFIVCAPGVPYFSELSQSAGPGNAALALASASAFNFNVQLRYRQQRLTAVQRGCYGSLLPIFFKPVAAGVREMSSLGNSLSPSLPPVDPVPSKWVEKNYYMGTARMLWNSQANF